MKFFQSKYYTPIYSKRNKQVTPSSTGIDSDIITRDIAKLASRESKGWAMMNAFCSRLTAFRNYQINVDYVITQCELVEDLTSTTDGYASLGFYGTACLYDRVYFHKELELFIYLSATVNAFGRQGRTTTSNLFIPHGVDANGIIEKIVDTELMIPYIEEREPSIGMLVQDSRGFNIRYTSLDTVYIDFDTMYHGDFESVSDEILTHMTEQSKTGLVILHGAPGTGKTSYIRWLSGQSKRKMVFVPPAMVPNLTQPSFIEFLMHNKDLTFIVEDAESTLNPRMGSEHSIVSSILNMTDGLMGDVLRCQFICTFNTPLTNIDSALLRPGRLLVRHEFKLLTQDEANSYLESVESETRVTKDTSLAELMNLERPPLISQEDSKPTFGFA